MAIVTPNPTGDGGRFDPFIFYLNQTGIQEIKVDVAPSRIAGRVTDKSSGKAIANASVVTEIYAEGYVPDVKKAPPSKIITTDANGYFELTNGANGLTWGDNAHTRSYATANGYANVTPMKLLYVSAINNLTIVKANGRNYNNVIEKVPGSITKFLVYGEPIGSDPGAFYKPIKAYIKREDGTVFTEAEANAPGVSMLTGIKQKFVIIPEDPGYFGDTVFVTGGEKAYVNVSLKRLKHRLDFKLVDEGGKPLDPNTVQVTINGQIGQQKPNSNGLVQFEFENVSVNNYTVQFTAINKSGYIPKVVGITNQESKMPAKYDIVMEKGASISGQVMVGNQYAKFAKVYIHYTSSEAIVTDKEKIDLSLLETTANEFGKYEIFGLPIKNNQTVKVHATLAPTADMPYSIKGEEKDVTITDKVGKADFLLSIFTGPVITNLYGFPIAIEKIEAISTTKTKVTGIVDLSKNYSKFTGLAGNKIRVSDVVFDINNKNQPLTDVSLDAISQLKLRYQDKYNVLLASTSGPLKITQTGVGGSVIGKVSIVDNSFNYPSSYINFTNVVTKQTIPFYLSLPGSSENAPNQTIIKAIYNDKTEVDKYFLSDPIGNPLKFSFIGFDATAKQSNSYIATDGKIHLDVNFKGEVPNATPSTVNVDIKDLVLDGNKIYPSKGAYPLVLNMQDWKLEVRDWTIDPVKGGIYSQNSLIKTGVVDIPVRTFNLRKDDFIVKNFSLNQLTLGSGLLNLVEIDTTNFHLVFDQACGSDQNAHWRFSGSAAAKTYVAKIPIKAVAGKFPATTLNVNYFQLISYNKENLISLSGAQDGVRLYNNSRFTFFPQSVSSSAGSYSLGGQGVIAVPRVNNVAMDLLFSNTNGSLDMQAGGMNLNFEGKGYVQFKNDASKLITSAGGVTSIAGTVAEPGKVNPIDCILKFGEGQPGMIDLTPGFELNLDGVGKPTTNSLKLTINNNKLTNGMFVENNDWTLLKFSGELTDPKTPANMVKTKPLFKFQVLGDISANADGITMEQATPLGDVKMTYDFASRRMMGSMHMEKVQFGSYNFTGDVEVGYGGEQGFLLMGAGQLNTGTLLVEGFGTFNIGVLFANSDLSENSIAKVTQYSKAKENLCWLKENQKGFKGFFISGGYDIINVQKGFDMAVASVYVNAILGVETSIGANFSKDKYKILIGAHGEVNAGMSAISGTSISGGIKANITVAGDYKPTGFEVAGNAGIVVPYKVSQYLVLDTLTFEGSQKAKIFFRYKKGDPKFEFELGSAPELLKCPVL
ncbi:MAG: carboxypeptidase regulatory-like domain-containing protein [Pedobacter sp.]|nr:MAG: carboxypeptidase regulatory-like domain-containing protein [Pedobacter sp.]